MKEKKERKKQRKNERKRKKRKKEKEKIKRKRERGKKGRVNERKIKRKIENQKEGGGRGRKTKNEGRHFHGIFENPSRPRDYARDGTGRDSHTGRRSNVHVCSLSCLLTLVCSLLFARSVCACTCSFSHLIASSLVTCPYNFFLWLSGFSAIEILAIGAD